MSEHSKKGQLFDVSGVQIAGPNSGEVSEATQAYIKAEVSAQLATRTAEVKTEVARRWRALTGLSWVSTTTLGLSFFSAYHDIPKRVREEFLEPRVASTVNNVIDEKARDYVRERISPLEEQLSVASAKVTDLGREAEVHASELKHSFAVLRAISALQEDAVAAKIGDASAFNRVVALSKGGGDLARSAAAAVKEIEAVYDLDASQVLIRVIVDPITKVDPGYSLDEALWTAVFESGDMRRAAVNTMSRLIESHSLRGKPAVPRLIQLLSEDADLRTRARIIRLVGLITRIDFQPLDQDAVFAWWSSAPQRLSIYRCVFASD